MNRSKKIDSFSFTVFHPDEVERQFQTIVSQCEGKTNPKEIIEIINKGFQNRMILASDFSEKTGSLKIYRIVDEFEGFDSVMPSSFSYNPSPGDYGRAHIPGYPVFYGANSPGTALAEMKDNLIEKKDFYLAEWKVNFSSTTIGHFLLANSETTTDDNLLQSLSNDQLDKISEPFSKTKGFAVEGVKHMITKLGDLFSLKSKDFYNITSAYAYHILYHIRKAKIKIDFLIYPSIANGHNDINIAVHPCLIKDGRMRLNSVLKFRLTEKTSEGYKVAISEIGELIEGGVIWKVPFIENPRIEYAEVQIETYDQSNFEGEDALNLKINNSNTKIKDYLKSQQLERNLITTIKMLPTENISFDLKEGERKAFIFLELDHGFKIPSNGKDGCIRFIKLPVYWEETFKQKDL